METIKVIIVDDNEIANDFIRNYLEGFEEVEVLGSCYSDEEEILMIDELKPEIVITDLVRNNTLSGLDILKRYKEVSNSPKFLVVTAGGEDLIDTKVMDGYIKKPIINYNLIIQELKKIKEQIIFERLPDNIPKNKKSIANIRCYKILKNLLKHVKKDKI